MELYHAYEWPCEWHICACSVAGIWGDIGDLVSFEQYEGLYLRIFVVLLEYKNKDLWWTCQLREFDNMLCMLMQQ